MNIMFSQALAHLRHEKGVSQRQAAQDLGVSQALLSHYENGIREPGLAFVARACDYYAVSADYLLGRTRDRSRSEPAGGPDPAFLMGLADSMSGSFADLCRKEPELGLFFRRLSAQLSKDLGRVQKPTLPKEE